MQLDDTEAVAQITGQRHITQAAAAASAAAAFPAEAAAAAASRLAVAEREPLLPPPAETEAEPALPTPPSRSSEPTRSGAGRDSDDDSTPMSSSSCEKTDATTWVPPPPPRKLPAQGPALEKSWVARILKKTAKMRSALRVGQSGAASAEGPAGAAAPPGQLTAAGSRAAEEPRYGRNGSVAPLRLQQACPNVAASGHCMLLCEHGQLWQALERRIGRIQPRSLSIQK
jgi:hypothetical protein